MESKSIVTFGIIIVLASALTGVLVYGFTENSSNLSNVSNDSNISIVTQTATPTQFQGMTRTYYIAADEVKWNYSPTGMNVITDLPLAADNKTALYTINGKDRIGSVYLKCLYEGYTDGTFTTKQTRTADWQHLGILGPVIHAEVGDTIKVVFKNNCRIPVSIHPHGVLYDKASEGAPYNDGIPESEKPGDLVASGDTYTYTWNVPERAGPGPHDPSSVVWTYHSHINEVSDTYAGLVGPMIITRHGEANPDGTPKGVDREFVTMFSIFDENSSPYFDYNIKTFAQDPSSIDQNDPDFQESNLKASINGYMFGNLPGLTMKQNTHVRWYVVGMGTETDLHTPHWHGNTLLTDGMRTDMAELLPMSMKVFDMYPDNPGTWLFHCHVNDHIMTGMLSLYTVEPTNDTKGVASSSVPALAGSSGTLKIGLATDPGTPTAGKPTRFTISFLDNKTNALEEHVDYKVTIMKGNDQVFGTSFLHTAEGSVTIPYQFKDTGNYNVVVEVDDVYFMPVSEMTQFSINVGNS